MPDAPLTPQDVRELPTFQEDERDVKAALIHARPFATPEPFKDRIEAGQAADAIKVMTQAVKAAEARRLETTKTWRGNTDAVNTEYAELLSQVKTAAIPVLKRKGLQFAKEERDRIAAEQKAEQERLDREAEQKAADSQAAAELAAAEPENPEAKELAAEAFGEAARAAQATPPERPAPKQMRGDYGSLGSYVKWKFEVVDPPAVPSEHLIPNEKSIRAAINAEAQMAKAQNRDFNLDIPGVRIYPEEIGVSR